MPEGTMKTLTVSEARDTLAEILDKARYSNERVVVTKRSKSVAAIVPLEDLNLLVELEARIDLEDAREAIRETEEKGAKDLDSLLEELDL